MSVVSRASRKKSWQTVAEVVSLLDVLSEQEKEVADRLRRLRESHGLTQEAAAQKAGVSNRQWQRWESGESEPRGSTLTQLSDRFGISLAELLGPEDRSQLDRIEGRVQRLEAIITRMAGAKVVAAAEQALQQESARAAEEDHPPEG